MRSQLLSTLFPLAILVLLLYGCSATVFSAEDRRPNIVWIFVEDMNNWMGCYGDSTVPTPNIDRVAREGICFERAYMPAGVCSATRSAIATGAMQTSLGIHNHRSSRQRVPGEIIHLPDGAKTVYQLMREAGYYVYSNPGKDDFNFVFDRKDLYDKVVWSKETVAYRSDRAKLYDKNLAKDVGFTGPEWRDRPEGKPFFAQIQLLGGKNTGQFRGSEGQSGELTNPLSVEVPPYYPDVPIIREEIAHHYDCIRQTDNEVGDILEALAKDELLDSTVVFFWTDHGMRLYRHKQWLYEGGIHVPLVVMGPGIKARSVRSDLVSGIDITVSTLALAGISRRSWMEGRDIFAAEYRPREYVIGARDRCDYTIDRVRTVVTERYKYIRNFMTDRPFMQPQYRDGRPYVEICRDLHKKGQLNAVQEFWWSDDRVPEELYDLEIDPHEIHNLANDPGHAAVLEAHREILTNWIKTTDDQGQYPESVESLRGVLTLWGKEAVNPEYDKAR